MSDMVEVVIDSVRVSLMSPQRLVVLRQLDADRFLPIWVGPYEAEAITVALQEIEMIRPLTHDLLKNVFTTFNTRITRVEIVSLREDIYYGNIIAESDTGQRISIDSRPSDAIALAVRAHVPILVSLDVMTTAGITPEKDITTQAQSTSRASAETNAPLVQSFTSKPVEPADDRLSVFEKYLSNLEMDPSAKSKTSSKAVTPPPGDVPAAKDSTPDLKKDEPPAKKSRPSTKKPPKKDGNDDQPKKPKGKPKN
jgi:bifunctional DNase/RNase